MSVDRAYVTRNSASRSRLDSLLERLRDADLARDIGGGWTVAALLAHLAFWDRFVVARLSRWAKSGFEDSVFDADLLNEAALPGWRRISGAAAREETLAAAERCDEAVAHVVDDLASAIIAAGRHRMLDRSLHRDEHIAQIEQALGG